MRIRTLALAAAALIGTGAQASINFWSPLANYGQSFDSLAQSPTNATIPWTNDSTLVGWSLFNLAGAPVTTYRAGTGSSNTGAFYSFGTDGDRALGGVGSGSVSGYIALALTNTSGVDYNSFTLSYDGEQWRNGGNVTAQTMALEYGFGDSFGAVSQWTALTGNFVYASPVATGTGAAVNGNAAGLVAGLGGTVATDWSAGSTLWLRWTELNDAGNDHGLGIDNVSIHVSAVPEPQTYALMLAGLGAIGALARRRKA